MNEPRRHMIADRFRRRPILWSYLGAFALAALASLTLGRVFRDEQAHLATHLTLAIPAWLLLASGLRVWPAPRTDRYSRIARSGLLLSIALLAAGASLEAVGAVGYEELLGIPFLAGFHPIGVVIGGVGIALTLSAIGLNLLVWGAVRAGKLESQWMPYAIGLAGFGGIAFVIGGVVFGY